MNLSSYLACLLCVALDMKFNNLFYIETKENPNYWVPNIIGCPIFGFTSKSFFFDKKSE